MLLLTKILGDYVASMYVLKATYIEELVSTPMFVPKFGGCGKPTQRATS